MELQPTWISSRAAKVLAGKKQVRVKVMFRQVANLESEDGLVAVQTPKVALTPISAQVDESQFAALCAAVRHGPLELTTTCLPVASCTLHASEKPLERELICRMAKLASVLGKTESLAFAADPLWATLTKPTQLQRKARAILAEVQSRLAGQYFSGAAKTLNELGGMGPGLTPAGDDFLIGVLAVCSRYPCEDLAKLGGELRETIIASLGSCVWLSAALLECAAQGEFSPPISDILKAEDGALARAVASAISWGDTSGSDTLGGILWALQVVGV